MKKTAIFLAIGMSFLLLLGLAKSDPKLQGIESECEPGRYWQKVKDYKIIDEPNLNDLRRKVKEELGHGWYPIGGISIVDSNCCQVMAK